MSGEGLGEVKATTVAGIALGIGVLGLLPIWKDLHHHDSKAQSGFGILYDQIILKYRAKHIPSPEALANAKARYALGEICEGKC